jgi:hypothetical protein
MLSHAHTYAPILPAFVTASVIAIASVALKHGHSPGGPSAVPEAIGRLS